MRAGHAFTSAQAAAAAVVLARLARGRRRRAPLTAVPRPPPPDGPVVSVVDPRARRGGAASRRAWRRCAGDPDVAELLVVDDRSSDATAEVARAGGARVCAGADSPAGWAGKPGRCSRALEAATGDVVVLFLDADTRPRPGLVRALAALARAEDADLVPAGPRFLCARRAERLLHPAMAGDDRLPRRGRATCPAASRRRRGRSPTASACSCAAGPSRPGAGGRACAGAT